MNTVNFQPKGIYQQFASNSFNNQTKPEEKRQIEQDARKSTAKKYAKYTAIGAAIVGGYFLHKEYKKGVDAINLKEKVLGEIKTRDDFDVFLRSEPFSTLERLKYIKIWNDHGRYQTNIVGTVHRFLGSISDFFKDNFYNY